MNQDAKSPYPIIYSFDGCPSEDGSMFFIDAEAFDGRVVRFAVPLDNIQHLIAFLLIWVGRISAEHPTPQYDGTGNGGHLPVPATSVAIGEPAADEAYLVMSVGRAELVFSLPMSCLAPIGQSLLMAGAPASPAVS